MARCLGGRMDCGSRSPRAIPPRSAARRLASKSPCSSTAVRRAEDEPAPVPAQRAMKPVPLFVGLNFQGNHAIHTDPAIALSTSWMRDDKKGGVVEHRATEQTRGAESSRWPVEMILARGYGVATAYYGDIDPDFDDGFQNGVHRCSTSRASRRGRAMPGARSVRGPGA